MANKSDVETIRALRLHNDSRRRAAGRPNLLRLTRHHRATSCKRGSRGPEEAGKPIAADGRCYNPGLTDATSD